MSQNVKGLLSAPHTPFHPDGSLNPDMIEKQAESLIENNIQGVFITGTTGESHLLSMDERMQIVKRWADVAGNELKIIAHIGHTCQEHAMELAVHAASQNITGIAAMSPLFYKPKTVQDMLDFHIPIAAAAPNKDFYFYDIPSMTNVDLPTDEYLPLAESQIPNFAGLKFTRTDLYLFQKCRSVSDKTLLFGADELLMYGMLAGADGAIGSTYNYAAPIYNKVLAALEAGDTKLAASHQQQAVELVKVLHQFDGIAVGKAIMGMIGIECGQTRTPNVQFSNAQKIEIYHALKDLDIFSNPLIKPVQASA